MDDLLRIVLIYLMVFLSSISALHFHGQFEKAFFKDENITNNTTKSYDELCIFLCYYNNDTYNKLQTDNKDVNILCKCENTTIQIQDLTKSY